MRAGIDGDWSHFAGSASASTNGAVYGIGPTVAIPLPSAGTVRLRTEIMTGSLDGGFGADKMDLRGFFCSLEIALRPS